MIARVKLGVKTTIEIDEKFISFMVGELEIGDFFYIDYDRKGCEYGLNRKFKSIEEALKAYLDKLESKGEFPLDEDLKKEIYNKVLNDYKKAS